MKKIYIDTETTGFNPNKNGLIQLAGIIKIDGEEKERFDFKVKLFPEDEIEQKALDFNGMTLDEIGTFKEPAEIYKTFIGLLEKYIAGSPEFEFSIFSQRS